MNHGPMSSSAPMLRKYMTGRKGKQDILTLAIPLIEASNNKVLSHYTTSS